MVLLDFLQLGKPFIFFPSVLCAGDEKTLNYSSSLKRLASMGRLMTPRSPSGNAFDYSGDSEDEGTALADEDATIYSQNVDSSADYINVCAYWVQALQSF